MAVARTSSVSARVLSVGDVAPHLLIPWIYGLLVPLFGWKMSVPELGAFVFSSLGALMIVAAFRRREAAQKASNETEKQ
jgi:hypothetical protein